MSWWPNIQFEYFSYLFLFHGCSLVLSRFIMHNFINFLVLFFSSQLFIWLDIDLIKINQSFQAYYPNVGKLTPIKQSVIGLIELDLILGINPCWPRDIVCQTFLCSVLCERFVKSFIRVFKEITFPLHEGNIKQSMIMYTSPY